MPFVKIWVHLIWTTKKRQQFIGPDLKMKLLDHIKINSKTKNIYLDFINCTGDHVHLLVSLKADQSISKVAQLIKGESSHWINDNNLSKYYFEWQEEYIAVSVSESVLPKVREYIKNQEEHHRVLTFEEEYQQFIEKYGFNKFSD